MTKTISKKPNTQPSTPSAGPDTSKTPGTEIYDEIQNSLSKFNMEVLFGTLDGRPDKIMEAFRQLNDLNSQALDTFLAVNREVLRLQARCDELWELKKSTRAKL